MLARQAGSAGALGSIQVAVGSEQRAESSEQQQQQQQQKQKQGAERGEQRVAISEVVEERYITAAFDTELDEAVVFEIWLPCVVPEGIVCGW